MDMATDVHVHPHLCHFLPSMFIGPTPSRLTPPSSRPLYVEILRYVQSSIYSLPMKSSIIIKKEKKDNDKESSNLAVDIYEETYLSEQEL